MILKLSPPVAILKDDYMKIKEANGYILDVFAVYWIEARTYFFGLQRNQGLIAFSSCEVTIEDASMPFRTVFFQGVSGYGVYHWALVERKLLDDIVEANRSAYNSFVSIIKAENLVSKDF